jgi:hypothetical protein
LLLSQAYVIPDQNNFGDNERVNQRSSIGEIRYVEFVKQQHAIRRQRAKEEGQVQEDYGEILKFVSHHLFQAGLLGIFITHLAILFLVRSAMQAYVVSAPK